MDYVLTRPGMPILVGGGTWKQRTQVMKAIAEVKSIYCLSLGFALSKALKPVRPTWRRLQVTDMDRTLATPPENSNMKGCVMDQIETLFLPDLGVNVLSLLRRIAREQLLVASWPGHRKYQQLIYAELGHPEYQYGTNDGIIYISLEE